MNSDFPIVYLSLLIGLLAIASVFLIRQVIKTRKTENALGRLQQKLSKEKGTAQEYFELGSIFLNKRVYSQAITAFQKSLKCSDLPEAEGALVYNALGYAYFAQEQYDVAIRNYKEALKINPEYVTALNNLGHAYERKQLTSQALEAYDQALTVEPDNTTAKRRADSLRKRLVSA
jgi:tetratricopeptide (TPR) repeat protein